MDKGIKTVVEKEQEEYRCDECENNTFYVDFYVNWEEKWASWTLRCTACGCIHTIFEENY